MERLPNIHPGEVLREEFLIPLGISQHRLAKAIGVPEARISAICAGKRAITADTALRLSRFLVQARASGWVYKPITTWRKPGARRVTLYPVSCNSARKPRIPEPIRKLDGHRSRP
jgi:addiction module HigA family antidote